MSAAAWAALACVSQPLPPLYMQQRAGMIEGTCKRCIGGSLPLSDTEQAADAVIRAAAKRESNRSDFLPSQSFFNTAGAIRQSRLFSLLAPLPKGAALHLHFDSLLETRWFVNQTYEADCHCCWPKGAKMPTLFRYFGAGGPAPPGCDAGWQPVPALRAAAANRTAFDDALYRSISLVPPSDEPYPSSDAAWTKFQGLFPVVYGLMNYEPVYKLYVAAVLAAFKADGVQRLEMRGWLRPNITYLLDGTPQPATHALDLWLAAAKAAGVSIGFIYSAMRDTPPDQIGSELAVAQSLSTRYPGVILGFDLVGQEDTGRKLLDFVPAFCASSGRLNRTLCGGGGAAPAELEDLPFVFHAGETKGDGTAADENLYDALLLGTARIGHGFSARSHPELRAQIRQRGTALEVCLLSNQVLGLVDDLRGHPFALFVAEGMPVVLSSDDPGFWGASGVSYDWWVGLLIATPQGQMRKVARFAIFSLFAGAPKTLRVQRRDFTPMPPTPAPTRSPPPAPGAPIKAPRPQRDVRTMVPPSNEVVKTLNF